MKNKDYQLSVISSGLKAESRKLMALCSFAVLVFCMIAFLCFAPRAFCQEQETSEYVNKAWAASGQGNFTLVYSVTSECIEKFAQQADAQAATLGDFPSQDKESSYAVMNDIATCYFIQAEALVKEGVALVRDGDQKKADEIFIKAKKIFLEAIEKYPFAQAWDPRGWFWSIKDASQKTVDKINRNEVIKMGVGEPEPVQEATLISLHDKGAEFPVNYEKYGEFIGVGTKEYKYVVNDPIGLAKAAGQGIHPNTSSIKFDPVFVELKKQLGKVDHWKVLNSRDLKTAFYKWNTAPEPQGVKQFYLADILERSGLIKHAIKSYHAVLVHFPMAYGWTYWQTPWYIGKVALYRIRHLLKKHPELNLKLIDADIEIQNGYDNDIRNDVFIVNPGKLVKKDIFAKLCSMQDKKRKNETVVKTTGNEKSSIKLVQYASADWQLLVNGEPFMVKGVTYGPTRVGESPDDGSLKDWTVQDTNHNDLIDAPHEAWVDKNGNNRQDKKESTIGDFALMKEMGVNAIRLYIQPFELNKELLRQMYEKYGIYVILGDFLGKYALGSGASWEEGTDYDNAQQQATMLTSIKKMVLEFKEEPYVLMWMLGNENVYGLGCNADKKPASFFKFANRAARLIKELDPYKRPVAVASGDTLFLDIFAKECPDVDIFGTNTYRGHYGFLDLWDELARVADKAGMITEYGCSSYSAGFSDAESQEYQAMYHSNAWWDIMNNSSGFGAGNAIGGIAFEWLDEWWKAYEPSFHDRKGLFAGPFLDGYMHEEWLGLCSQGEGKHSPFLRVLKKSYYTYQNLWNDK